MRNSSGTLSVCYEKVRFATTRHLAQTTHCNASFDADRILVLFQSTCYETGIFAELCDVSLVVVREHGVAIRVSRSILSVIVKLPNDGIGYSRGMLQVHLDYSGLYGTVLWSIGGQDVESKSGGLLDHALR